MHLLSSFKQKINLIGVVCVHHHLLSKKWSVKFWEPKSVHCKSKKQKDEQRKLQYHVKNPKIESCRNHGVPEEGMINWIGCVDGKTE